MPLSAALATNRATRSRESGRFALLAGLIDDQHAAAQGDAERRLAACPNRPNPLPRALDAAAHRGVEATAARDLQVGKARAVQDLGKLEHARGLHLLRERFLREEPDAGVDEGGHA